MKYIDADKLIAYLKEKMESYKSNMVDPTKFSIDHIDLMALLAREYQALIENITPLQQEQPEVDLVAELKHHLSTTPKEQLEKEWKELEPWGNIGPTVQEFLYGKQPEVELEKFTEKIKTFQSRYTYPECMSAKGAMMFIARMFYQYPNVARQWYEQLPKATMD